MGLHGLCCLVAFGRLATAAWPQQAAEGDGIDSGNYNIKQSVEFGYRFTDFTGSQATYDTFVNLQQGPRLLDMTLEMRSLNHQGVAIRPALFEQLRIRRRSQQRLSSAHRQEQVVRLQRLLPPRRRMSGTIRCWPIPLNPASRSPMLPPGSIPSSQTSPHLFDTRRRMGDYNLTLLPESQVRFRLGYSRNVNRRAIVHHSASGNGGAAAAELWRPR